MHELSLTHEIVEIVCNAAGGRQVHRVMLDVGRHSCASPEAIEFCFAAIARGTLAEGARLEFRRPAGDGLIVATMKLEEAC